MLAALAAPSLLAGCNNSVTVQLMSGPQMFELTTASVTVPAELADGSSIASIPCSTECPSVEGFTLSCTGGVCDPQPVSVSSQIGDVVDFDTLLSEASTLLRFVDAIEVTSVTYEASPNSLTVGVPDIEIYWGPEGAAGVDSPGVTYFGTIPAVPASTAVSGAVSIDAAGSQAMSDYVVNTSRRIRFFARTDVDLQPGGPLPGGAATVTVNMTVRATGRLID